MFDLNPQPFFDYCIQDKCIQNNNYEKTIKTLYDYGYRTVAINQVYEDNTENKQNKKQKKGETREGGGGGVPPPHDLKPIKGCEDLKLLNRLTIVFGNQSVLPKITSSINYKKYDIIAVLPTTDAALTFVSGTFEADIICFNPEHKLGVKYNRKTYNRLVERGYYFEIAYSPAIVDSTQRKNLIQTAHLYHSIGKSRNVIMSSGASNSILIRSPYDVINLGLIFGLNKSDSKNAISLYGRQVYLNSVGRRNGKSVMFIEMDEEQTSSPVAAAAAAATSVTEVISLIDNTDDCIEIDQPTPKKVKH